MIEGDGMGDIEHDERRWTLKRSYVTGAPHAIKGQFLAEGEEVEVVPAADLRGAVEALRLIGDRLYSHYGLEIEAVDHAYEMARSAYGTARSLLSGQQDTVVCDIGGVVRPDPEA